MKNSDEQILIFQLLEKLNLMASKKCTEGIKESLPRSLDVWDNWWDGIQYFCFKIGDTNLSLMFLKMFWEMLKGRNVSNAFNVSKNDVRCGSLPNANNTCERRKCFVWWSHTESATERFTEREGEKEIETHRERKRESAYEKDRERGIREEIWVIEIIVEYV